MSNSLAILAVQWDEIAGPSIISHYPQFSIIEDPNAVALQIYMASVTVFGQYGESKKIEFSIPLLSLGENMRTRVAFDSWKDNSVRGGHKVFFLAFIMDNEIHSKVSPDLNKNIWQYSGLLKEKRENFVAEDIYKRIAESMVKDDLEIIDRSIFEQKLTEITQIIKLQDELADLIENWEQNKDPVILETALLIGNSLEKIDDIRAGEAFYLSADILFHLKNTQDAMNAYIKSASSFVRGNSSSKTIIAYSSAAKCAYKLGDYKESSKLLSKCINLSNDEDSINPILILNLAFSKFNETLFTESKQLFETSIKLAQNKDNYLLAARATSAYASRVLAQINYDTSISSPTEFVLDSGKLRKNAADLFKKMNLYSEAATSLILSANNYFSVGETKIGINLLKEASQLYYDSKQFENSGKSLLESINHIKPIQIDQFIRKVIEIFEKINDSTRRMELINYAYYIKGRTKENNNDYLEAIQSYEEIITLLVETDDDINSQIPLLNKIANLYFKLEFFKKASEYFEEIIDIFKMQTDSKNKITLVLNNLSICLKQAADSYHRTAIVLLESDNEEVAFRKIIDSLVFLKKWKQISEPFNDKDNLYYNKHFQRLKNISNYLMDESRKSILKEKLKDLAN